MYVYIGIYKNVEIKEWVYKNIRLDVLLYIYKCMYIDIYRRIDIKKHRYKKVNGQKDKRTEIDIYIKQRSNK